MLLMKYCILNLAQCSGNSAPSPFDVCNTCGCQDGLITPSCTEAFCSRGKDHNNHNVTIIHTLILIHEIHCLSFMNLR